jgi:micrococcal nuclease
MKQIRPPRPVAFARFFYRSLFLSLLLIILSCIGVQAETNKVIRVYDGYAINILNVGKKQSIRLVGIDTPEKSRKNNEPIQPYSPKAAKFLAGLVLDKHVLIESYGIDRYGCVLGVVWLGNTYVNLGMVRNGYAEVYRGRPAPGFDNDPYWQAEAQAKAEKLNIWSLGDAYVSPKEWRQRKS